MTRRVRAKSKFSSHKKQYFFDCLSNLVHSLTLTGGSRRSVAMHTMDSGATLAPPTLKGTVIQGNGWHCIDVFPDFLLPRFDS